MAEKGKYWLLEGVGRCGKTTIAPLLVKYLNENGRKAEETREPGGVEAAEDLRNLIFELKETKSANADNLAALFMASRYFLLKKLIIPKLEAGIDVVAGRGYPSTKVYQGLDGANFETMDSMTNIIMTNCWPDAILFLDISAQTAYRRRPVGVETDPFDKLGIRHFERVVASYRDLYGFEEKQTSFWYRIDAEKPVEEVMTQVKAVVNGVLDI